MRETELNRPENVAERKGAVRAGLRYVFDTPPLWIGFMMLAIIGTLSYNFAVTLPIFVTRVLHSSERTFTLLYSTFSAGAVVCSLIIAHRGLARIRHIILGAALLGVTMLLLAPVPSVGRAPIILGGVAALVAAALGAWASHRYINNAEAGLH